FLCASHALSTRATCYSFEEFLSAGGAGLWFKLWEPMIGCPGMSRNPSGTKTRERVSPALELAQKLAGLGAIAAGDLLVGGHATLTRRGLALELVLVVHAFTHDLASAGHAHALLGAAVRLLLRHGAVLLCNSLPASTADNYFTRTDRGRSG